MSFIKIDGNNFEQVTLALRPPTEFISSSVGLGSTGSAFVSPLRSKAFKQDMPSTDLLNTGKAVSEEAIAELVSQIEASAHVARNKLRVSFHQNNLTNIFPQAQAYLNSVGSASQIQKNTKKIDVLRFDLPVLFNKNRNIKNIVKSVNIPVVACSGAGSVEHFLEAVKIEGLSAIAAGNYFNYKERSYPIVKKELKNSNINVR